MNTQVVAVVPHQLYLTSCITSFISRRTEVMQAELTHAS